VAIPTPIAWASPAPRCSSTTSTATSPSDRLRLERDRRRRPQRRRTQGRADKARATKNKPTAIVAKTFKGRGVTFLEDKENWHGKPLKKGDELNKALASSAIRRSRSRSPPAPRRRAVEER
jgi:hypothetical protein